ncbi:MAG: 50S ribosomal protein L11 methyltransferase [Chitinophagaceae bacterium]
MTDYIEASFENLEEEKKEILIALLAEEGFEAFEEEASGLKAFIAFKGFDKKRLIELATSQNISFTISFIRSENWNRKWEYNFHPVVIDEFCAIRASFHQPIKSVQHEIIITPKMSFGTGHHATTEMMVRVMRGIDFDNKSVFDFGTGTGILAILAEKLGAAEVTAIDYDNWSIENAKENTKANECNKINIIQATAPIIGKKYDIILCNIIKKIILENFSTMVNQLNSGGYLILSGLLKEDRKEINEQIFRHHLKIIHELEKENWICLSLSS